MTVSMLTEALAFKMASDLSEQIMYINAINASMQFNEVAITLLIVHQ